MLEFRRVGLARKGQFVFQCEAQPAGIRKEDANPRGHLDGLFDVVGDHEDALETRDLPLPEGDDFMPQSLSSENIESTKGFIEAKQFGFGDEGARQTHPLAHTTGDFTRVRAMIKERPISSIILSMVICFSERLSRLAIRPTPTFCSTVSQG